MPAPAARRTAYRWHAPRGGSAAYRRRAPTARDNGNDPSAAGTREQLAVTLGGMADSTGARSESDLPIEPVYDASALADFDADSKLGAPGRYPFTRGVYPSMYTGRPWTMRQYAGFGTAKESNERYHQLVKAGTGGLSVAFDLPTQMGYDSDEPIAHGEVGKVGVAIDSLDDMRTLFDGLPLDTISTSMTINAPGSTLLLLYQLVAEEQGVPGDRLTGTIQNDVLKEYIARGTYIYPPRESLRLISDIFAYCHRGDAALEHHLHLGLPHGRGRARRPCRRSPSRSPTPSSTCAPPRRPDCT